MLRFCPVAWLFYFSGNTLLLFIHRKAGSKTSVFSRLPDHAVTCSQAPDLTLLCLFSWAYLVKIDRSASRLPLSALLQPDRALGFSERRFLCVCSTVCALVVCSAWNSFSVTAEGETQLRFGRVWKPSSCPVSALCNPRAVLFRLHTNSSAGFSRSLTAVFQREVLNRTVTRRPL